MNVAGAQLFLKRNTAARGDPGFLLVSEEQDVQKIIKEG